MPRKMPIYEFEDLKVFCKNYDHLFIYGSGEAQQYLRKYLELMQIPITGFTVSSDHVNGDTAVNIQRVMNKTGAGVILGLSDRHYEAIIPMFRNAGFTDYFMLSENSKIAVVKKLKPKNPDEYGLEINLTDHCNLDCQMCDHYSPLAAPVFLSKDAFERDIKRLSELTGGRLGHIFLMGGEPLLHEEPQVFGEIAREYFPTTRINYYTNGLLLLSKKSKPLWETCRTHNIGINISCYPNINLDMDSIIQEAINYGVHLVSFTESSNRASIAEKTSFHPSLRKEKSSSLPPHMLMLPI